MNGARRKVQRLPADLVAVVWSIEIGLGRVNSELVEAALSAHGRRLVVLDSSEVTGDLVGDMIEVLASFCARPDGLRSARPGDQSARVPAQARSSVGDPAKAYDTACRITSATWTPSCSGRGGPQTTDSIHGL